MGADFILRKTGLSIHPPGKIIKKTAYQEFVKAENLVARAHDEAREIRAEAAHLIDQAKEQAAGIIADARRYFISEKKRGHQEGIRSGKAQIADQITQTSVDTTAYLNSIEVEIANTIVSALKIIIGEIGDETVMRHLVSQALNTARDQKQVKLRVAPQQVAYVTRMVNEIQEAYGEIEFIDVAPEGNLSPGSCILETKMGFVDTSVDVQLETIRKALHKRFKQIKA